MKIAKKICKITGIILLLLIVVFLAGRYGWKLWGFQACQSAGIENITVDEDSVTITGFYPGSFPEGFCGYYAQEQDGKLYVGFRFSAVFGFFETGDFEITIPVKGEISEVILKTSEREDTIWSRETSNTPQAVLPGTEKPSALELKNILDEINLDIQPGAAWNDMTSIKVASHLLNWGVGTSMETEEVKQTVDNWLSDKGDAEQADFKEKLAEVYGAYQQLLGPDAEKLLETAGCEDTGYPWSDSPVDTIETMVEAVQLPEREVYPGADVVELVNRKGDTTTAYKLADGRYMDRIDRIFVFDGMDTWTDESGVEWNEAVK